MKGYSQDLRERVLAAVARGMPRQEVITTFAISSGSLKRWLHTQRYGPTATPPRSPGPKPTIALAQQAELAAQVKAHPDATIAQHAELWNAAHGTTLSQWTCGRAIRSLGLTCKKRPLLPANAMKARVNSSVSRSAPAPPATSSSSMKPPAISA